MMNFRRTALWFLLLAICKGTVLCAATRPVLSSVEELDDFLNSYEVAHHRFVVTGLVTYACAPHPLHPNKFFVIQGDRTSVILSNPQFDPPPAGSKVAVEGLAYLSTQYDSWTYCSRISVIGKADIPKTIFVNLDELASKELDLKDVTTEATVIEVMADEIDANYAYLLLKEGDVTLPAACPRSRRLQGLMNAKVRIRGLMQQNISSQRKHLGPCLTLNSDADISVLVPPPADPFAFPPLPKRLYMSSQAVARLGKRTVRGYVIAIRNRNRILLSTPEKKIVGVELADGEQAPPYGSSVTVVGHPGTDLYRITLTSAHIRIDQGPTAFTDDTPETITVDKILTHQQGMDIFSDEFRGKLFTLQGVVRNVPVDNGNNDNRIFIDCGQHTLPVDCSANPRAVGKVTIGCLIEVTGRCLIETEGWRPDRIFPRISGITIVIRKPDDIRVLSRPPWWTPQRLLFVIAGLLVSLLALFAWNRFLNHLVRRKSRDLMQEEVARIASEMKTDERTRLAVELHDSLSQSLAGIAYQLTSCKDAIKPDADAALNRIKTADRMLKSCRTELRHRLHDLRSDMLEEPDFEQAVRKTLFQLEGDANIVLRVNVPRPLLTDTAAQDILSIIRELVSNALRHGAARSVRIAGCVDGALLRFSVRDDGSGFDPAECPGARQGHFGLAGIRYRLMRQRGELTVVSAPGAGARMSFQIPLTTDSPKTDNKRK